jgi:hypothetical protein
MGTTLSYAVNHAFNGSDGVYRTRENADTIKELPRAERDRLIKLGHITEFNDGVATEAAHSSPPEKGGK